MTVEFIDVHSPSKYYQAVVGDGIISKAEQFISKLSPSPDKILIIVDENLESWGNELLRQFSSFPSVDLIKLTVSEELKAIENIIPLYNQLLERGLTRKSLLIAVGGGVIGDFVGFLAASYMRGIRWVGVPTTLLAAVDSSIGGKTGVNLPAGKNLVGAFWQPELVLVDTRVFQTLSERDYISGLGEILKYGLIFDADFFNFCADHFPLILGLDPELMSYIIAKCIQFKANTIEEDERDLTGAREVLNFGHTVAHALESLTQYGHFRHGEAVLIGMDLATRLSEIKGTLGRNEAERICHVIEQLPLPSIPPNISVEEIFNATKKDKKNKDGFTHYVLLAELGATLRCSNISLQELEKAITNYQDAIS